MIWSILEPSHDGVLDDGLQAPLGPGPPGARHHIDQVRVGEAEHVGHLRGGGGVHDHRGDRPVEDVVNGRVLLEAIDARLAQGLALRTDIALTDDLRQSGNNLRCVQACV